MILVLRATRVRLRVMDLRPYMPVDRDACLAIFDSNTPQFFDPGERATFEAFLDRLDGHYVVMEHEGALVGCGGYTITAEERLASLVWGMVRRDSHKLGLGRYLLLFRLREIGKSGDIQLVHLDTSQRAAPFFERQGFKVIRVVPDGYGNGLDRVEMVKKLIVCA
jgi:N-acetylglutamate synthase-like GNAT family acetyltransferase